MYVLDIVILIIEMLYLKLGCIVFVIVFKKYYIFIRINYLIILNNINLK